MTTTISTLVVWAILAGAVDDIAPDPTSPTVALLAIILPVTIAGVFTLVNTVLVVKIRNENRADHGDVSSRLKRIERSVDQGTKDRARIWQALVHHLGFDPDDDLKPPDTDTDH